MHGHAEVRQVFQVSKVGSLEAVWSPSGTFSAASRESSPRGGSIITEDLSIESLKRLKEEPRKCKSGLECRHQADHYDDVKVGDVFGAYIRETIQREACGDVSSKKKKGRET